MTTSHDKTGISCRMEDGSLGMKTQKTVTLFLQIMMQTGPQQTPTLQTSLT